MLIILGVQRFCYKKLMLSKGASSFALEIDGMAFSDSTVVLVERKPVITMKYIEELEIMVKTLRSVFRNVPPTCPMFT